MRKMLNLLGTIQLAVIPALTVVSCDTASDYKQFEKWINNGESFILYIGATDCSDCDNLQKAFEMPRDGKTGEDYFREKLDGIRDAANGKGINGKEDQKLIGYDKEINKINFYKFKYDKHEGIWSENKSMKKISEWLQNRYLENYSTYKNTDSNTKANRKLVKANLVEVSSNGTPIFIIVRNGKLVGVSNGFSGAGKSANDIDTLIKENNFENYFEDYTVENLVTKVEGALSGSQKVSTQSLKTSENTNFNYDNVNLDKYL